MIRLLPSLVALLLICWTTTLAGAQILRADQVEIQWKVINRFRLFKDERVFQNQENAWRQYVMHVEAQQIDAVQKQALIAGASVLGIEHVLNDRFIAFSRTLRKNFDWRGWASAALPALCWNPDSRKHDACGGSDAYVMPRDHDIEVLLKPKARGALIAEFNCIWRVGQRPGVTAPCDQPVRLSLPYPDGADISVAIEGEQPIFLHARVRDLLIVGLGDSFGSGEGNPDRPVRMSNAQRYRNLYPQRAVSGSAGNAQWMDHLCHRSLYGHQLRAALQIAIENPQTAVTFLGYSCSGATVEMGLLGPHEYVERNSSGGPGGVQYIMGGEKEVQFYWLLREICAEKPQKKDGLWVCPHQAYRRPVDYVFLSVGGNDIGFASVVAWATLREGTSATLAKWFGVTTEPRQFAAKMDEILPKAYARLAKALEVAVPLRGNDAVFDPSRVIITAYPDILVDEKGAICRAERRGTAVSPANQSLDGFSAWLETSTQRLTEVHEKLADLNRRMTAQAGDLGWTFAARVYQDKAFTQHGFCAMRTEFSNDPSEMLRLPCWTLVEDNSGICQSNWSSKERKWKPYDPQDQNYPYALRQRWVRTFNDAYMTINEKVMTRSGQIDDKGSAQTFSEAVGAMHPNAEGQAAMADAMLLDFREIIARELEGTQN